MKVENLNSYITGWGTALAIAMAISWVSSILLPENVSITKNYILLIIFTVSLIISGLLLIHHLIPTKAEFPEPRVVRYIHKCDFPNGGFVVKSTDWLNQNSSYAVILEQSDGYEKLLGIVKYVMSQNNGLIQLITLARTEASAEIWNRLDAGETDQLSKIRIKIGMPADV